MSAKNKKQHLDLYNKCMETGRMKVAGLCNQRSIKKKYLNLFKPTEKDYADLRRDSLDRVFWGSGLSWHRSTYNLAYNFSPLRQTIVLLIAAMNKEL